MSRNVLAFAETREGKLRAVALETLAAARTVAEGGIVHAVVLGQTDKAEINKLAAYGADRIIVAQHQALQPYTAEAYTQALAQVVQEVKPDAVLLGHTAIGKEVAPRVAAKSGAGLIADCIKVTAEGGLEFARPIYAGKAFEKRKLTEGMIFATIRPNNVEPLQPDASKQAEAVQMLVDIKDLRTIVREVVRKAGSAVDLSEAKIIVSGGRGVKSAEGFKPLQDLADVLGGAVGASRGACDQLYCDYSLQIGQTGKVVTPDLYIACGISGAIQHLAGMSNSRVIVAINKDPEAPIFGVADYGIVGDLFEVLPILTEEFKKMLNAS